MNLIRAIEIATAAHAGQTDKAGADYIQHPLRVMEAVGTENMKIVAVLHDVVEDCPGWSFERLEAEGFSPQVIEALRLVTKIEGETYDAFVQRAASNPVAREVKIADLRDNMDLSRLPAVSEKDLERVEKYRRALVALDAMAS